jgi:ABC-type transport system involved in multi-copper enzyme maturation permease subunit
MQWAVENLPGLVDFLNRLLPVWVIPILLALVGAAVALGLLVLVYRLLLVLFPKVTAIALTTAKEAISQPLFWVILGIGAFLLVVIFPYLPYNTFGEDIKMVKDSGLVSIMLLAIIMALWTASVSISEEIEGRTALTLLSKPIGRRQFILGKFLGILVPVLLIFIVLGWLFLGSVSYKVVYDSRESGQQAPTIMQCAREIDQISPGLVLAFLETVVLTAISVAISTRLPMLPNLIICATVYVVGHLVPLLVNSAVGRFEIVRFMGQLIATVFPVLDHFNIQAAVATGKEVPLEYLGWAALYCVLYSTFALLFALLLFEDRDLA